jgi:hypothetical protein
MPTLRAQARTSLSVAIMVIPFLLPTMEALDVDFHIGNNFPQFEVHFGVTY